MNCDHSPLPHDGRGVQQSILSSADRVRSDVPSARVVAHNGPYLLGQAQLSILLRAERTSRLPRTVDAFVENMAVS